MTSSDLTSLPHDAKSRAATRVGSSLDPAELANGTAQGLRVGFACAEFNGGITDRMLAAALDELDAQRYGRASGRRPDPALTRRFTAESRRLRTALAR